MESLVKKVSAVTQVNTIFSRIFHSLVNSSIGIILFSVLIIIFEMEAPAFYPDYWGSFNIGNTPSLIFYLLYTLIFFLVFPALYNKFCLKENVKSIAWQLPVFNKNALIVGLICFPVAVICLIGLSHLSAFQVFYGIGIQHISLIKFILCQLLVLPLYYLAEEFFFRGFLFFTLWKRIGWHALWITEFLFTIAHIGKPSLEILYAIPVGIVLNLLTLWTRSLVPAIFFHTSLGIILNLLMYIKV